MLKGPDRDRAIRNLKNEVDRLLEMYVFQRAKWAGATARNFHDGVMLLCQDGGLPVETFEEAQARVTLSRPPA